MQSLLADSGGSWDALPFVGPGCFGRPDPDGTPKTGHVRPLASFPLYELVEPHNFPELLQAKREALENEIAGRQS